jgi:hypothetical protein
MLAGTRRHVGLLLVTLVALAACSTEATPSASSSRTISGTLTLLQDQAVGLDQGGQHCAGTGPFQDVRPGAELAVTDGSGRVLGTASLVSLRGALVPPRCDYSFTIPAVATADSYSIALGERRLGTFARDDLENRNWEVNLAIGP